jgi:hypothetical protein
VKVTAIDDARIVFSNNAPDLMVPNVSGSIDRVTGALEAEAMTIAIRKQYSLKCKPTQRMFLGSIAAQKYAVA